MRVQRNTLAGTWYPADAETLGRTIDTLLDQAADAEIHCPHAAVVPHAAYQYSGAVAAAAYRQWRGAPYTRAVILAPSHRVPFRGAATTDAAAFETPLGRVDVDPATRELTRFPLVQCNPQPFHGEHSLEIQLPLLQRVLPRARVVPLLLGDFTAADCRSVRPVLDRLAGPQTLFIASSDFTHYGWRFGFEPFPARDAASVSRQLAALDQGAIAPVLAGDATGFQDYVAATGATICGRMPIAVLLTWLGPHPRGALLAYQTSLDLTGDYEHSVSYAAIVFPKPPGTLEPANPSE
jgi:AmmeMemoRadiSam system protein B